MFLHAIWKSCWSLPCPCMFKKLAARRGHCLFSHGGMTSWRALHAKNMDLGEKASSGLGGARTVLLATSVEVQCYTITQRNQYMQWSNYIDLLYSIMWHDIKKVWNLTIVLVVLLGRPGMQEFIQRIWDASKTGPTLLRWKMFFPPTAGKLLLTEECMPMAMNSSFSLLLHRSTDGMRWVQWYFVQVYCIIANHQTYVETFNLLIFEVLKAFVLHLFQEPQDYADWVIDQIDPDRSET